MVQGISELLLVCLSCTLLAWYVRYLWGRRKLYIYAHALPGPVSFPLIGSILSMIGKIGNSRDILKLVTHLCDTYPGLFRIWFGPRLYLAVTEPKYFEILFTHPHSQKKGEIYRLLEPMVGAGVFSQESVPKWRRNRKLIAPTFNQKILDSFVEVFRDQSEVLNEVLEKHAGKGEFDVFQVISRCTLDIICETAMGVKIQGQTLGHDFPKWTDDLMEIATVRFFNILYHIDFIFYNLALGKKYLALCGKVRDFTREVINNRKKEFDNNQTNIESSGRKAFLDQLLAINQREDNVFTDEGILDETVTFMIGGSDTTATTMSFTFTMLGLHQDIQDKVLEEVLDVVGPHKSVEITDLPHLKYTERVIKESMRLFPIGTVLMREVEEDIDLGDGNMAPKGASVLFGIRKAHTTEKYWPNPFKFDPNRFLPEEMAKSHPCAFIPFSFGPRNCVGMRYAYMAMKCLLATVIRKYKINTSYKSVEEVELKMHIMTRPAHGYKVSLELRN